MSTSDPDDLSTVVPGWIEYGACLIAGRRALGPPGGRIGWPYALRVHAKAREIAARFGMEASLRAVCADLAGRLDFDPAERRRARRDMQIAARVLKLGLEPTPEIPFDVAEPIVRADMPAKTKRRLLEQLDARARKNEVPPPTVQDARRLVGEALLAGDSCDPHVRTAPSHGASGKGA